MEFKQLEMFVALAEERSVQGAAARVFRTAPAVSIAMRKLEDEVGAPLFDRSCRTLTEAGELLYPRARRLLGERSAALAALDALRAPAGRVAWAAR